jgi:glycosyltransferase involved in cell wall biosynthesis
MPLLSILIPTYNRQDEIQLLLTTLLQDRHDLEICIHDDGSNPPVEICQSQIEDGTVKLSSGHNKGRAHAILQCYKHASGQFVMIFDDDDEIYQKGIDLIMEYCALHSDLSTSGFMFDMDGGEFQMQDYVPMTSRSGNFLSFRADMQLTGDKKEIVRRSSIDIKLLQLGENYRRVPTSLYWASIALHHGALYVPKSIGRKNYRINGMSDNIKNLKKRNLYPMLLLYQYRCKGYFLRKYYSKKYLARSVFMLIYYYTRFKFHRILR